MPGNRFRRVGFPLDGAYSLRPIIAYFNGEARAALAVGTGCGCLIDKYVRRISRFERFVRVVLRPLRAGDERERGQDGERAEAFHLFDSLPDSELAPHAIYK